jgi:hypothetical protein
MSCQAIRTDHGSKPAPTSTDYTLTSTSDDEFIIDDVTRPDGSDDDDASTTADDGAEVEVTPKVQQTLYWKNYCTG